MSQNIRNGGPVLPQGRPAPASILPGGVAVVDETEAATAKKPAVQSDNVGTGNEVLLMDDSPIEIQTKEHVPESEKLVWIKMAKNHGFTIADTRYNLIKDTKYRVTREVREILRRSPLGLLDPVID